MPRNRVWPIVRIHMDHPLRVGINQFYYPSILYELRCVIQHAERKSMNRVARHSRTLRRFSETHEKHFDAPWGARRRVHVGFYSLLGPIRAKYDKAAFW